MATESTTVTTETVTTPSEPELLSGDVNGDNQISVEDAQLVLVEYVSCMAGLESGLTDQQKAVSDVDGDKQITVEDAQYILLYYVNNTLSGTPVTWDMLIEKKAQSRHLLYDRKLFRKEHC
jgi:hypothetical protein